MTPSRRHDRIIFMEAHTCCVHELVHVGKQLRPTRVCMHLAHGWQHGCRPYLKRVRCHDFANMRRLADCVCGCANHIGVFGCVHITQQHRLRGPTMSRFFVIATPHRVLLALHPIIAIPLLMMRCPLHNTSPIIDTPFLFPDQVVSCMWLGHPCTSTYWNTRRSVHNTFGCVHGCAPCINMSCFEGCVCVRARVGCASPFDVCERGRGRVLHPRL